ncbi:hypothetical protein F5Y19DRAFT_481160 [Xylariaceae sp. FL1651]|nr:hypothetical protein F5Y19DRAFT_481160 [Xylariaceae sp. FL1651]
MKSSTLFIVLSTTAINGTYAGCYDGEQWGGERAYANQAVDDLCDPSHPDVSQKRRLYTPGQNKANCYTLSGSKTADFSATWGGQGDLSLTQVDCVLRLKNEINGCDRGGSTDTADWTFTAYPNDGTCDPPSDKTEVKFTA